MARSIHIGNGLGCLLVIVVVFGPGVFVSTILHNGRWAILLPIATIGVFLGIAALPSGRNISPQQYADELERHLRGEDSDDDWDRTGSVRLKNPRMEELRRSLPDSFDDLRTEEDRLSLARVIEALRKGELPEVRTKS